MPYRSALGYLKKLQGSKPVAYSLAKPKSNKSQDGNACSSKGSKGNECYQKHERHEDKSKVHNKDSSTESTAKEEGIEWTL